MRADACADRLLLLLKPEGFVFELGFCSPVASFLAEDFLVGDDHDDDENELNPLSISVGRFLFFFAYGLTMTSFPLRSIMNVIIIATIYPLFYTFDAWHTSFPLLVLQVVCYYFESFMFSDPWCLAELILSNRIK